MKKFLAIILVILAMTLAACGATNGQSTQSTNNNPASQGQGQGQGNGQGFGNRPISLQEQLAVGTFKLEGTPQAVDANEAAQLLPLWQLFGQLESSSSSAPQEVSAVVDQIKSTMTPDQINAINAMNLTNRDAFTFMQQQGILPQGGFAFDGTPQANRTPRAGGGNGFGGGFVPGGGPGGPNGGGQNLNPSQIATLQARRAQGGGFSNRLPQPLLDALFKLLQSKIGPVQTSTPMLPATEVPATPTITPRP